MANLIFDVLPIALSAAVLSSAASKLTNQNLETTPEKPQTAIVEVAEPETFENIELEETQAVTEEVIESEETQTESEALEMDENATVSEPVKRERTREEIIADLNRMVAESYLTICMQTSLVLEDGESEGNLTIDNKNNYETRYDVYLQGTTDLIYTTGDMAVGAKIDTVKLNRDLEKGNYSCDVVVQGVRNGAVFNKGCTYMTIIVKN